MINALVLSPAFDQDITQKHTIVQLDFRNLFQFLSAIFLDRYSKARNRFQKNCEIFWGVALWAGFAESGRGGLAGAVAVSAAAIARGSQLAAMVRMRISCEQFAIR